MNQPPPMPPDRSPRTGSGGASGASAISAGSRWRALRRAAWLASPMLLCFVSLYCVRLEKHSPIDDGVPPVRVWLKKLQGETSVSISSEESIQVETTAGREIGAPDVLRHTVAADGGWLRLDGQRLEVRQVRLSSPAPLRIGERSYRGSLLVSLEDDGRLRTVNHIDLETYLSGVVGSEIPALSASEALKAQAVAARTYTLWRMARNSRRSYDLTDDTYSQVYSGALEISERVLAAVEATHGEVLAYEGKFLPAYYHSTCGGHTSDQRVGFGSGEALAPLGGTTCGFCTSSRYYTWNAAIPRAEVDEALSGGKSRVTAIRPLERDELGRWWKVEIETEAGRRVINANGLRMALGPNRVRGTLIDGLRLEGDEWIVRGQGWGHGVGMCQIGAMTLGQQGWSYRRILAHYYPGAALRRPPDARGAGWLLAQ